MLIGVTPFYNRNRNMLLMKIKNSKVIFPDKTKYKIEYSDEIVDLIVNVPLNFNFYSCCKRTRPRDLASLEMDKRYWHTPFLHL